MGVGMETPGTANRRLVAPTRSHWPGRKRYGLGLRGPQDEWVGRADRVY